ncbi:MAG: hypothetical protein QM757_26925 [Paludibaculum sp.]
MEIELQKVRQIAKVLPGGIPAGKLSDAQRLNQAYAKDAKQYLLSLELSSRGYSSQVQEQALWRLPTSRPNSISYADQVLLDMMRQELPWLEYEILSSECNIGRCSVFETAVKREPWIRSVSAAWK